MKIELLKVRGLSTRPLTRTDRGMDGNQEWAIFEDEKGSKFKVVITKSEHEMAEGRSWLS